MGAPENPAPARRPCATGWPKGFIVPILAVGSIALDTVETADGRAENALGGSAVYFSCAASLFAPVQLVGVVGRDFPAEHIDFIKSKRIDTAGLEIKDGVTFRWHGRYHRDMNVRDTIDVQLNVFGEFEPNVPESFRDTEYVFLANAHPAIQMKVIEQVRGCTFCMADTMNLWVENHRDELDALMRRVDGLLMNDEEARLLTGRQNLLLAGQDVLKMGPKVLIIKKGEHGSLLFAGGACVPLPAFPVHDVVDPTGAGDSFAGGLMGYIAETGDTSVASLRRALAYATVTASFTVEDFSLGRIGGVTRQDVDARLADYRDMLTV